MSVSIPNSSSNSHKNNNSKDDAGAAAVAVAVADTIDVTIRFSASLPDLPLSISLATHPHANTCTLKQLIRRSLPAEAANRRIRLICAGKALLDNDLLTTSLRRRGGGGGGGGGGPTPWLSASGISKSTPLRASSPAAAVVASDKGKTPIRDPVAQQQQQQQQQRIYIHCSIGDLTLPPDELEREARTAAASSAGAGNDSSSNSPSSSPQQRQRHRPNNNSLSSSSNNLPQPRGFDRLLASGFSAPEVASLRLQFLSIQSHTHTPDTMPSPTTLRSMEDAWLDGTDPLAGTSSSSFSSAGGGMGGGGEFAGGGGAATANGTGGGTTGYEATEQSALDDMLLGTAMGFFWPIGCLLWGVREEGVWSTRRKMAVVVGVCLNLVLGLVKFGA